MNSGAAFPSSFHNSKPHQSNNKSIPHPAALSVRWTRKVTEVALTLWIVTLKVSGKEVLAGWRAVAVICGTVENAVEKV